MAGFFEDEDKLYRSLREYSRVEAFLPVRIRPVLEEERQNVRSRIVIESALTEHPEMPQVEDEILSACLQILNAKLDSIIRLLAFPSNSHKDLDFQMVNISAGGLSTSSDEVYSLDNLVEIRLMLPTAPFMIFYVYGKVIKCDPACQKYEVCVEFTEIDDDIREQIAKYVFHRQREILRKKRSLRP
ncbi:MAG: PilZ domain-containing protein [Syntrophobacteraceae bacterium]